MSLGSGLSGAASGAATGAGIGSFVPGIGTLIGGGIGAAIGGIAGLFHHGDTKDEEEKFDPSKTALSTVKGLTAESQRNKARGQELGSQATQALAPVIDYYKAVAGNDPNAAMSATAPERGRVIDQYDAARKAASVAAPRGGGTTSAIVQSYVTEANQLSDLQVTAKRDATQALGNLGINMAGLGLSADQLASQDLDSIIQAVLGQQSVDAQKGANKAALWSGVGNAAGTILGAWLSGRGKPAGATS